LADAAGTLRMHFDESQVRFKTAARRIPGHLTTLTLATPLPQQPRVQIDGDMLALNLYGETPLEPVRTLMDLWYHAAEEAIQRQQQKTYRRNQDEQAAPLATFDTPALAQAARQVAARDALQANARTALALDLDVQVKDPDLLAAFVPMLPALPPDFASSLHLEADADHLRLTASVAGDSLHLAPARADMLTAEVEAAMNLSAPLEQTLTAQINLHADSLQVVGQGFSAAEIAITYADRQGHLTLQTQQPDVPTPARLAATLEVLSDRNRLTLQEVALKTGTTAWHTPKPAQIDLYPGVVVVPDLLLASQPVEDQPTQRVRLYGALSRAPQDTFFVEVADIGLRDLASLRAFNRPVGGELNGRVALTNAGRPELTGRIVVDALSLDNDTLGRLEATSRYVPGSPDVALDVLLTPIEPDSTLDTHFVRNNRLRLAGSFRLPQVATDDDTRDPGALDLTLDADRADVFFFEYLFSDLITDASGALAGTGAIRGTFDYPLFEADLDLSDGRFNIPRFNLAYEIDGHVTVDEEAIRLDGVSLRDKTGGNTTVNGALLFNEYRYFSFDLAAQLREMQIINVPNSRELPFYGAIWASGNATLTGPLYNTQLEASNVITTAQSEIFIPITEDETEIDPGFIVFTDSTGQVPDLEQLTRRKNILASRPEGERAFLDGMEMDLNIFAPQGSTVHLVIDPLLGDVINAVGSGRIQLQRQEGDFQTFGSFTADSGDYLFTAGEVFVRRFLIESGTITWDGDPLNARLDIQASYRTRASRTGLPTDIADRLQSLIPLVVNLNITGRVAAPQVGLNLAVDRSTREPISDTQFLETYLNQPDRAAQMATSVLLTNSFILTTEGNTENGVLAGSAFNSVSQLVSSQLNRYLSQVVPNADFSFGVQGDETAEDLDLTAGLAIRLLDERLIIRGQGVYRGIRQTTDEIDPIANQGIQGEFAVEVRLSPSVSVEVFYRREGDVFSESILTNTTGAGLSYNTQFTSWRKLYQRIFGTSNVPETAATTESVSGESGRN
ncbi:MAG TPA: translocation/assembly module TamB domain-containing protein, partial [Rhodothermales bacterium]|nr:translocation/assembly module TamB domain-containing protein [Rhodothermales bacterium]